MFLSLRLVAVFQFEKRRSNIVTHGVPKAADVPRTVQAPQPAVTEQKVISGNDVRRELTKPLRDPAKPSPKDSSKDKAVGAPLREWDRHKLRQSRSLSRERRRKEDKARTETQDKKEISRQDQQKSRDERRGRSRTDKPGL